MPNRILKESICVSEQIDELSLFEEVFFYRLLVNCDDYGCMDAREKVLASKLFPLRSIKPSEILRALEKLAGIGLIATYEVDEKPYLKVVKWAEHQRLRISKHKYPEPTEEQLAASCGNSRQVAANCGELPQNAASGGKLRPESEYEYEIESEKNPKVNTNSAQARNARFDRFWAAYPRHEAKQAAQKAFDKLDPDDPLMERIIGAIDGWKKTQQWQEDGGKYIPHPATWLNQRRWEDEIPKPATAQSKPVKTVVAQQYDQRDYSGAEDSLLSVLSILQGDMREGGGAG